jgi:4-hydroxythreonine-4-phosphate dehydrogenase
MTPLVLTSGEPAGIGPELCAMLATESARRAYDRDIVVLGDRDLLVARAARIGSTVDYPLYDPGRRDAGQRFSVWHLPVTVPVAPGEPDPANADYVRRMLELACDACATGAFGALCTAPVQKSTLLDAGIAFTGHTEFFAERTGTPRVVMLLVGGATQAPLRVALATTHLPLAQVPAAITRPLLADTLRIIDTDLRRRFAIAAPRIAVCGLNPHAGEGGHLGREEIDVIAPAIAAARAAGLDVSGPYPADTIFVPDRARHFDVILAMFHDQGLPVLKAESFGGGVNVTLGLPFIRTSVDHGTALDLARDAMLAASADPGSLITAVELALHLARATSTSSAA